MLSITENKTHNTENFTTFTQMWITITWQNVLLCDSVTKSLEETNFYPRIFSTTAQFNSKDALDYSGKEENSTQYMFMQTEDRRHALMMWNTKNYIRHLEDRASWYILIMKANEMHYFSNLFDKVLHMFRTGPLSIISGISTLYTHSRYLSC